MARARLYLAETVLTQGQPHMPASYATTPLQQSMRTVAERALEETDGLRIKYTVQKYGTLKDAKSACRRAQIGFAALRTKERRKAQNLAGDGHPRDTFVWGRYDKLSCWTSDMPNDEGFYLHLTPAHMTEELMEIETADGQPLDLFGQEGIEGRITVLVTKMFKEAEDSVKRRSPMTNPWNDEETAWIRQFAPAIYEEFDAKYGVFGAQTPSHKVDDMADMDLDEWVKEGQDADISNGDDT